VIAMLGYLEINYSLTVQFCNHYIVKAKDIINLSLN